MKTLQELNNDYHEIFYVEDQALFPLLLSVVIGARLNAPPVWLYIIGPSSGGKSTVISTLNKIPFITEISDLTPNTFLSGAKVAGKETSLLKRMGNNFVVVMKDFTTMLAKDESSKSVIISHMREIYDGYITKATGNGDIISWGSKEKPWKGTFIMATTEGIYKIQEEFADMGTRAINYIFLPQNRKKTTKVGLKNKKNNSEFNERLGKLQSDVAEFVLHKISTAPPCFDPIGEDLEDEIIDVADMASMCRSVVQRNWRGEKNLALSAEFPMRMSEQLMAIAQFLTYANDGELTDDMKQCVYKVAFDSIPKQRRMILEVLASYKRIEVSAASIQMNYPPELVRAWIEDLHMHGVVDRSRESGREWFHIRTEYRDTMRKYLGLVTKDEDLQSNSSGEVIRPGMSWEEENNVLIAQQAFDEVF
jgi:hypothetical protein